MFHFLWQGRSKTCDGLLVQYIYLSRVGMEEWKVKEGRRVGEIINRRRKEDEDNRKRMAETKGKYGR